jgi:Leucine-rich repeat (LRR) protein
LNLEKNKLTSLPAEVGKWTNLQFLNLEKNKLTSLPAEVSKWTRLQDLNEFESNGRIPKERQPDVEKIKQLLR